jgi:hypothetical protein
MGSSYYELLCDEGYMCPEGSYMQQRCVLGTFQAEVGQESCDICPAGIEWWSTALPQRNLQQSNQSNQLA